MLALWLLALAPVVAILYLIWAHRKRMAMQAAARAERLTQIFGSASSGGISKAGESVPAVPLPARTPAETDGGVAGGYSARLAVLSEMQARLLAGLRAALPQHEVLPLLNLAALVEVPRSVQGREREQRKRTLAQYTFDCVVCTRELEAIAAVDMESADAVDARFKAECLKLAGLRYVRLEPSQLEETRLRSVVLGAEQNSLDERHP